MNPYLILKVNPTSGDEVIRAAYLAAVKAAPPDLAPREFQAISGAYEQIKDERARHMFTLLDQTPVADSPLDALIQFARLRPNRAPLPLDALKEYLQACTKIP